MDSTSRILASSFIPYVPFSSLKAMQLDLPDDGVVAILAGKFHTLSHAAFIVNFTLLQVFIIS